MPEAQAAAEMMPLLPLVVRSPRAVPVPSLSCRQQPSLELPALLARPLSTRGALSSTPRAKTTPKSRAQPPPDVSYATPNAWLLRFAFENPEIKVQSRAVVPVSDVDARL